MDRPTRAPARALLVCVAAALAIACAGEKAAPEPSVAAHPAAHPAAVSAAQFASLEWLSGRWRGTDATGAPFFEAYVPSGGGIIRKYDYADSTFSVPTDSGMLRLVGDTLFTGSPSMQWVATQIDSSRVEFAPWRGASNGFIWQRTDAGGWTATLQWDSAGVPKQRVYDMRAVR